MRKKNVRAYILEELERRACEYSAPSLSQLLSGQRKASFSVAKELAPITKTKIDIWMDSGKVAERVAAVERLAKRKKLNFADKRGRPRKGE